MRAAILAILSVFLDAVFSLSSRFHGYWPEISFVAFDWADQKSRSDF
jgi:hypothetical protein